jgi:uncharacterized Zn-finger protein
MRSTLGLDPGADGNVACAKRRYEITMADLPLSCPPRNLRVWDAHPRVYLPIEETSNGRFLCPYCSAEYILTDFAGPVTPAD